MHNKKLTILLIIALAVIALLVFQLVRQSSTPAEVQVQQPEREPEPAGDSTLLGGVKFELGEVIEAKEGVIRFTSATRQEKVALLDENTQLKKQVRTEEGIAVVDAELSDFSQDTKIVVYYIREPEGDNYFATKVQNIEVGQ